MSETSEITRPLIDALNQTGGMALRMNCGTIRLPGRTIKLHDKGTADILFFPRCIQQSAGPPRPGEKLKWEDVWQQPCWLETKIGKNGQDADQRLFQLKVEALGHRYILATSVEQGRDEALR
jgi:hypothetical protein